MYSVSEMSKSQIFALLPGYFTLNLVFLSMGAWEMTRLVSFSCLLMLNMYEGELDKYIGVAAGIRISQTCLASFVDLSNFVI